MKVKITNTTNSSWYSHMIGEILDVDENDTKGEKSSLMYKVNGHINKRIYARNCVKIDNAKNFPTLKESYNFGD